MCMCYSTCKQLTIDVCTLVPTNAKKETHSMNYILEFDYFIVLIGQ